MLNIIIKDDLYDSKMPLFHYTSIESLYKILNTKTLKFNSLLQVDDLEEQEAEDCKDYGKYCFISCFSTNEKENIALWNMYSTNMCGVRIEFPPDFFDYDIAEQALNTQIKENNLLLCKTNLIHPIVGVKIQYTDEKNRLFPKIWTPEVDENYPLILNKLGKHKSTIWAFQEEARYVVNVYPDNWFPEGTDPEKAKENAFRYKNIPDCVFVPIKPEVIPKIKLLIAPRASDSDISTLKLIAIKYDIPITNITTSCLRIKKINEAKNKKLYKV